MVFFVTSLGCAGCNSEPSTKNNGNNGTDAGNNNGNNGTDAGNNGTDTGNNNGSNNGTPCGNGVLDQGEECDPGIAAGNTGACPTSCPDDGDPCTGETVVGQASDCSARCEAPAITECTSGDQCCPMGCDTSTDDDCGAVCGNGVVEGDETCDGNCPTEMDCDDGDACTNDALTGDAASCDAACENTDVTACTDDDGCCPNACDATNDNDCSATCGNGAVEGNETCDGNCPTSAADCDDADACTTDTLNGSATNCTAECQNTDITMCINGDGCCAPGCNAINDDDCMPMCGNGVVEGSESCDGNCPTSCDDGNACTSDTMTGDSSSCDVACTHADITACGGAGNSDGCCPAGCNSTNDGDCSPTCGNGVVETGESCDGNCPSSCDDGNACTNDSETGQAGNCNLVCNHTNITTCTNNDGCCGPGCNVLTDNDCSASCGNNVVEPGETCDGNCPSSCDDMDACTIDGSTGSTANCSFQCTHTDVNNCVDGDGCCAPGCDSSNDNDCMENQPIGGACGSGGDCVSGACFGDPITDGYCSAGCLDDTYCTTGSHCGFIDASSGVGVCVADCTGNSDCRTPDYQCFDADDDGSNVTECWAVGSGTGDVGDACDVHGDCAGGQDGWCVHDSVGWKNGYCTRRYTAQTPCPSGSHRAFFDSSTGEGVCLKDCTSNNDCRTDGYLCYDVDNNANTECAAAATGNGQVGDACQELYDCAGGADGSCLTQDDNGFRNGYCTESCSSSNACPTGSHCSDPANGGVCLKDCAGNGQCRPDGYLCYDTDDTATDTECWVAATGTGQTGEPCGGYWECVGGQYGSCLGAPGWPGGYCTLLCGSGQATCGSGTECYTDTQSNTSVCLDNCMSSTDCRTGYACTTASTLGTTNDACTPQ